MTICLIAKGTRTSDTPTWYVSGSVNVKKPKMVYFQRDSFSQIREIVHTVNLIAIASDIVTHHALKHV